VGGVVLIHYMVGWDAAIKEMTRKLAYNGLTTIAANIHFSAGKVTSQENSASVRESGGMPDDRGMGDVQGAMQHLRSFCPTPTARWSSSASVSADAWSILALAS